MKNAAQETIDGFAKRSDKTVASIAMAFALGGATVAGIPARVVGRCTVDEPALEMDSTFPYIVNDGAGI